MSKRPSGGTPAAIALTGAGISYRLHSYRHQEGAPAYGDEAAEALGINPRRIFKTLVAELTSSRGTELVVAVVPVSTRLDLKALAAAAGAKKGAMAEPAAASRSTGYVLGGISPLGQRTQLRTVVDTSALSFETILVSAGKRGLEVELAPHDLVSATSALVASIGA